MNIGDPVHYTLDGYSGHGWIIGETSYSEGDVFVFATKEVTGMPINKHWLRRTAPQTQEDLDVATALRSSYLDKFPGAMKPSASSGRTASEGREE